jgi:hypothetical protein
MTEKILEYVEIYPKIFVYKNLFKDINKTCDLLKEANEQTEGILSPWTQWSHFGEYLNPIFKNMSHSLSISQIRNIKTKNQKQEEQKLAILELYENFYLSTQDYILKNNVEFDINKTIINKVGTEVNEWKITGPSIAKYKTTIEDPIAMTYHSDYIREPIVSPGYKFAITALAYFNDDYSGGEIDFIVNGEAYMYKPEAGDFLIFPSGHPDILTKDNSVYIHGVMPAKGTNKILSRMYWTKYSVGDDLWFKKEKEFGKEVWESMQPDIMQKFRDENPNKFSAENERRIK